MLKSETLSHLFGQPVTTCQPDGTFAHRFGALTESDYTHRIAALRVQHGLSFCQDPGGGEFSHPHWGRLQVGFNRAQDDYEKG